MQRVVQNAFNPEFTHDLDHRLAIALSQACFGAQSARRFVDDLGSRGVDDLVAASDVVERDVDIPLARQIANVNATRLGRWPPGASRLR